MSGLIVRHDEGSVRTLTLNRPEKLNALSSTLVEDLSIALMETAGDPEVRAVVIGRCGSVVLRRVRPRRGRSCG